MSWGRYPRRRKWYKRQLTVARPTCIFKIDSTLTTLTHIMGGAGSKCDQWGCGGMYRRYDTPGAIQPFSVNAPEIDNTWEQCFGNGNAWACPPET